MHARLATNLIASTVATALVAASYAAVPALAAPDGEPKCRITGTRGNDVLMGTAGPDVMCGLGGNDELYGFGGDDILVGGVGKDRLYGGRGADQLLGGGGRDYLQGERGGDVLRGGAGDDDLRGDDSDIAVDPGADEQDGSADDHVGDVFSQLTVTLAPTYYVPANSKISYQYAPSSGNCLSFVMPDRTVTTGTPSYMWRGEKFRVITTRGDGSCLVEESYGWWDITITRPDGSVSRGSLKVAAGRPDGFAPRAFTHCANFPPGTCSEGGTTEVADDELTPYLRFR